MYKCVCGFKTINKQQLCSHKGRCEVHLGDRYEETKRRMTAGGLAVMQQTNQRKHQEKLDRIAREVSEWISEQNRCEKCNKVMSTKFGSGKYCSRICANTRQHTEESKRRISQKLMKPLNFKFFD